MNAQPPALGLVVRAADLGDPGECARIDDYVRAHPDSAVFHRPQWSRAVALGCGHAPHYLLAERGGALVGCLPLSHVRSRLFGNAFVSVGFGTGGGILADGGAAVQALAETGWQSARLAGCTTLELRGGPLPEGWTASGGVYANFTCDLPPGVEALIDLIPRRQRAEVRRAHEHGLEASTGADRAHGDAHFEVYAESVRNLGTPVFPKRLFAAALDEFGADADILLVRGNGRPLAALLNFYHKGVCQPYWGGGTAAAREWRANDFMYYAIMRHALERGCRRVDFGRSKLGTGAHKRKKIWDFVESPLTYGVRSADGAAPREVNPLDPRYRLKIAAWRKLPLWLANRLGPLIARGLG